MQGSITRNVGQWLWEALQCSIHSLYRVGFLKRYLLSPTSHKLRIRRSGPCRPSYGLTSQRLGCYNPCCTGDFISFRYLFTFWHSNMYVFCFSKACSNYLIIYRGTRGSYGSWSNNVTTVAPPSVVFATVDTLASADNEGDYWRWYNICCCGMHGSPRFTIALTPCDRKQLLFDATAFSVRRTKK